MDDLISRQEAIDAVTEHAKWLWETWRETCSLAGITEVINNLPPAQPETHDKRTETHACDSISRQAAIDALLPLYQEHRYKIPGKRETYSQYNAAWQDALSRAEGAIFDIPSAQPEWIPVTEVMPDEHNRVLILTDDGTIFIGDHNEYWEDDYEFEIDDVIAWMLLPEPLEGEKK